MRTKGQLVSNQRYLLIDWGLGTMTGLTLSCRLSSLEELSGMETLASDKTGTLTLNKCGLRKAPAPTHLHDVLLLSILLYLPCSPQDAVTDETAFSHLTSDTFYSRTCI